MKTLVVFLTSDSPDWAAPARIRSNCFLSVFFFHAPSLITLCDALCPPDCPLVSRPVPVCHFHCPICLCVPLPSVRSLHAFKWWSVTCLYVMRHTKTWLGNFFKNDKKNWYWPFLTCRAEKSTGETNVFNEGSISVPVRPDSELACTIQHIPETDQYLYCFQLYMWMSCR